jgi:DNA-binding response OmpR family regulator
MNSALKKPKILVVEDDHTIADLLCTRFEREGYHVRAAYDGQQALELVEQDPPDVITLNVAMPALDGFEVCRRLITPSTKLVTLFNGRRIGHGVRESSSSPTWVWPV